MKWLVLIGCLATLTRCSQGNALRCSPGSPGCTENVGEKDANDAVFFDDPEPSPVKKPSEHQDNTIDKGHKSTKRSVCKPNQEFPSECNTCKCAADGLTYSCTQNECLERDMNKEVEVFMESEGVDHIERHSVCKPSDTFYISCNTCHCNSDGTNYTCTNKLCPLPEDVELFHELKVASASKNKTIICEANRSFKKDCNTCWCNEDGTSFYCTRKACVPELPDGNEDEEKPEDLRIIMRECRPNEVFELDCNMCRCNPDGKSFSCTRRACIEQVEDVKQSVMSLIRNERALSQDAPRVCLPGTEFRKDCNTCLCDDRGEHYSCTRKDCYSGLPNAYNDSRRAKREATEKVSMDCTPSSVFERGCNVCRCTDEGHALCTTNKCKDQANKPSTEVQGPDFDKDFRCNPGEQYGFDCNDCTCSADGKSIFCTVRFCDQHLSV